MNITLAHIETLLATIAAFVAVIWFAAWLPTRKCGPLLMFLLTATIFITWLRETLYQVFGMSWFGFCELPYFIFQTFGLCAILFLDWLIFSGKLVTTKTAKK